MSELCRKEVRGNPFRTRGDVNSGWTTFELLYRKYTTNKKITLGIPRENLGNLFYKNLNFPWKFLHPLTFFSFPLSAPTKFHTPYFHLNFYTPHFHLNFHTPFLPLNIHIPIFFTDRLVPNLHCLVHMASTDNQQRFVQFLAPKEKK